MSNLVNLTPHQVNIIQLDNSNNEVQRIEIQSSGYCRVSQEEEFLNNINLDGINMDIPLVETVFGEIEFPEGFQFDYTGETQYIVSRIVKNAILEDGEWYKYFVSFIVPNGIVRDSNGVIQGCKGFSL